jgi:hypothetical protein
MKVRVVLVVDVDPQTWHDEYGVDDVREDMRRYLLNAAQSTAGIEFTGASVSLGK